MGADGDHIEDGKRVREQLSFCLHGYACGVHGMIGAGGQRPYGDTACQKQVAEDSSGEEPGKRGEDFPRVDDKTPSLVFAPPGAGP